MRGVVSLVLSAVLLMGVGQASAGVIYWDAAASYCSDNQGMTCCTKKTIDADETAGAKTAQVIQQCAVGQGFMLKIPYPRDATSNNIQAVARLGNATTNTGVQCWEVSVVANLFASGNDTGPLGVTFPTSTNSTMVLQTDFNQTSQWKTRRSVVGTGDAVTLMQGATPTACTAGPTSNCQDASVYVKIERKSSASAAAATTCTDTKTGDAFIPDGYFIY